MNITIFNRIMEILLEQIPDLLAADMIISSSRYNEIEMEREGERERVCKYVGERDIWKERRRKQISEVMAVDVMIFSSSRYREIQIEIERKEREKDSVRVLEREILGKREGESRYPR